MTVFSGRDLNEHIGKHRNMYEKVHEGHNFEDRNDRGKFQICISKLGD